jgi:hypothetical protein
VISQPSRSQATLYSPCQWRPARYYSASWGFQSVQGQSCNEVRTGKGGAHVRVTFSGEPVTCNSLGILIVLLPWNTITLSVCYEENHWVVAELGRAMFQKVRRQFLIAESLGIYRCVTIWESLWTRWHWKRFCSSFFKVSVLIIIAPLIHSSPPEGCSSEIMYCIIIPLVFKL